MSDKNLNEADATIKDAQKTTSSIDARRKAENRIKKESPDGLLDRIKNMSLAARRINKV